MQCSGTMKLIFQVHRMLYIGGVGVWEKFLPYNSQLVNLFWSVNSVTPSGEIQICAS